MTDEQFALAIEEIRESTGLNYVDSIILWCERNQCEIESAAHLIKKDPTLRMKLMRDASKVNLLKIKTGNTIIA